MQTYTLSEYRFIKEIFNKLEYGSPLNVYEALCQPVHPYPTSSIGVVLLKLELPPHSSGIQVSSLLSSEFLIKYFPDPKSLAACIITNDATTLFLGVAVLL